MVFVHARNATVKTALTLREMAANQGDATLFHAQQSPEYGTAEKQVCNGVILSQHLTLSQPREHKISIPIFFVEY